MKEVTSFGTHPSGGIHALVAYSSINYHTKFEVSHTASLIPNI